jgi:very-short-patch-repair endonuclease
MYSGQSNTKPKNPHLLQDARAVNMWKAEIPTTSTAKNYARELRRNPTPAEQVLWQKLRCKRMGGVRFHRQKAKLHYILDFYCPKAKLAIEVDGPDHDKMHDAARDGHLKRYGILTLRFTNGEVVNEMATVLAAIYDAVNYRSATKRAAAPVR